MHHLTECDPLEMESLRKTKSDRSAHPVGEIRIAVGLRLYELFCADCNRVLIEEDSQQMRLQCTECKRIYAYRLPRDQEDYIFRVSSGEVSIQ